MKTKLIAVALAATILAGCQSNPSQGEMIGGVAGALVGSRFGKGTGQLVGTAAGALIGAGVGRALDGPAPQQTPVYVNGTQVTGQDGCVQHQMELGQAYGPAASYCNGMRQRRLEEQRRIEQDAWRRGYNGF